MAQAAVPRCGPDLHRLSAGPSSPRRLEVTIRLLVRLLPAAALLLLALPAQAQSPHRGDWRSVVAPAPPAWEPTVEDLERLLADESARLVTREADDGRTLPEADPSPLLERLGSEAPCGTLVVRVAERLLERAELDDARRDELLGLLEPPSFAARRETSLSGLRLGWDTSRTSRHALSRRDADGDGEPDLAEAAAADLRHALERLSDRLAWSGPSASRPLAVDLASSAWREGRLAGRAGERRVLLPASLGGEDRLRAAAHQLAHVALAELAPGAPAGWEEAAATFLAEQVVARATGRELSAADFPAAAGRDDGRRHPRRALSSPGLADCRSDAAFLAHLDARSALPEDWLAELWSELAGRLDREAGRGELTPSTAEALALESLDAVLGRAGTDLASEVSSYLGAALEDELLGDPGVSVDARLSSWPAVAEHRGAELPPFGQLRFAVPAPESGGLRIDFESDGRAEAEVFALLAGGELRRLPLGGSSWGDRMLRLPGGRLIAAVVLVSAPLLPADLEPWRGESALPAPGDFRLAVDADAAYPFVLEQLTAEARVDQVRIDWTTSTEEDLVAWHLERARRLSGPWRRVTGVPVPPSSQPGTEWSYTLVDAGVSPGTRYHYRVVGLTTSGLAERTGSVSVLTLPEGPGLEPAARR